jgi:hypothetical protein
MRVLCSVVQSFVLPMLYARQDLTFCCTITPEFIGNNHSRNVLQPFKKFAEKSLGCLFVASALHQDIKHVAVLIHCSPEVVLLTANRQHDLVHMPCVSTTRAPAAPLIGVGLPECEAPLPNGFIGHDDASLCQKLFDRTENSAKSGNRAR